MLQFYKPLTTFAVKLLNFKKETVMSNVFVTVWDKVVAWFKAEAPVVENFLSKEEQELLTLLKPILAAGEASLVQDLVKFLQGVASTAASGATLADLETAALNGLEVVGGELRDLAKSLGSNLLQAILGLILAQLVKTA